MVNNFDSLSSVFREYKIPAVLSLIGILMLVFAAILLVQENISSKDVVFSTSEATSSADITVQVDVEGAVVNPGVYRMEENSRIADALSTAGGLSKEADLPWVEKYLNRAAKVVDGGKIYIPSLLENEGKFQNPNSNFQLQNSNSQNNTLGVSEGKINVNTASKTELDSLPGVGEVISGKIIAGRPYANLEELKSKKAVGNALFEKIKEMITVD